MPGVLRLGLRLRAPRYAASSSQGIARAIARPSSVPATLQQNRLSHTKTPVAHPSQSGSSSTTTSSNMANQLHNARHFATAASGSAAGALDPLHSLPPGFEIKEPSSSSSTTPTAPYALFTKDLERSSLDDRKYRIVCLANGLEILLISDPTTDKSSAAMDVRVGHLSDPKDFMGLAHFCEHLLFMGTEKFPKENEYSEFLSNHSGSSNAYTGMDNTNYFFDVGHPHLEGALDRFSQFFICPIFDASCTEREIRAVDSEHKKNLQSDAWRSFQLDKSLSDPAHPYSNFGTGSAKTLWDEPRRRGQDIRDELLKFHDQYYSANMMKLVILGRESLDQLNEWAVSKFSSVRNKGLSAPEFPFSPLGKEQQKTQIFFRTVKDIRLLDITFPIPDQHVHFRSKPGQILSHFVGHEGQGSILSHLKNRGWANHLSAGSTNGANGFEFFKISIDLTKDGLASYDKVVAAVFRYIELLKQSNIPEWSYNEVSSLCDLAFRFSEKMPPASYTSSLSSQMQVPFPREWVLSGPFLTREFNLDLIKQTLACLSPEKCRVSIAAQQCPDGSKEWNQKERWYGTEYKMSPLPADLLAPQNGSEFADLALPEPNNFIPQNFDVIGGSKQEQDLTQLRPTRRPQLLRNTPKGRLWHKKDDQFFLPKANMFLLLRTPLIDATPANAVKTRVFTELLKDAMTEYAYDAELAGLGYNIEAQADGIGISVDGYNDKLPVLLSYIIKAFKNFQVQPERFELIKDQIVRLYENFRLEAPYQHANYFASYATMENMWTPHEKLQELLTTSADDIARFVPDLLSRLHVEMLAHGNVTSEQALSLMDMAESTLSAKPLSPSELISPRSLMLPVPSDNRWRKQVENPENVNSGIEVYCQVGDIMSERKRATLSLLSQIASEPAFDQLRTKEQLGYLVFSGVRKTIGSMGFRIIIQSERDAAYLESRIEAFWEHFKGILEKMSAEDFEKHRSSLIAKKLETVKNLGEESSRFWFHVHSGYYNFFMREIDVENLREITKEDVMALFMDHIHPSSTTRARLAVHVQSQIRPKMFSVPAAEEFKKQLSALASQASLPAPPEEAWAMLSTGQTSIDSVKDFVKDTLASSGASEDIVGKVTALVDSLAAQYPGESSKDSESLIKQDVGVIDDIAVWKAGLVPSLASRPVKSWDEFAKEPERKELEASTKAQVSHL